MGFGDMGFAASDSQKGERSYGDFGIRNHVSILFPQLHHVSPFQRRLVLLMKEILLTS